jgi:hypothetical protein
VATILSDRAPGEAAVWYATMRSQTRCNIGFDVPSVCASVRRGALYQIEAANAPGCRRVYVPPSASRAGSDPPPDQLERPTFATRTILPGRGDELIDLAVTNVGRHLLNGHPASAGDVGRQGD